MAVLRGPKGEDVCWNPTAVNDPPLNIVKGTTGYGFNLDGTTDGHATAKSCAHKKFTSPDGATAVDNQVYRILGCMYGFRAGGVSSGLISNEYRRSTGRGVMIMEITGVTDPRESENVEVAFYRAIDRYALDSAGEPLPYASYRIDASGTKERYGSKAKGRIHEGVLTTTPAEVELPSYGAAGYTELHIRDMQMTLDLTAADGKAKGLLGGYYDLETWWSGMRRSALQSSMGDWSCPATYVASKQLADGYPDPKTGECTAISTAYRFTAIPAFIAREGRVARRP